MKKVLFGLVLLAGMLMAGCQGGESSSEYSSKDTKPAPLAEGQEDPKPVIGGLPAEGSTEAPSGVESKSGN
ncbi:MAG: hypothetical protein J0L72_08985 [Armatimonadetes bacterium]|nr:hypothetical protein [Armatimonadota bacterium]